MELVVIFLSRAINLKTCPLVSAGLVFTLMVSVPMRHVLCWVVCSVWQGQQGKKTSLLCVMCCWSCLVPGDLEHCPQALRGHSVRASDVFRMIGLVRCLESLMLLYSLVVEP